MSKEESDLPACVSLKAKLHLHIPLISDLDDSPIILRAEVNFYPTHELSIIFRVLIACEMEFSWDNICLLFVIGVIIEMSLEFLRALVDEEIEIGQGGLGLGKANTEVVQGGLSGVRGATEDGAEGTVKDRVVDAGVS